MVKPPPVCSLCLTKQDQTLQSRLDQLKTEISDLLRPSQAYDGQDNDALTELQSRIDQCDQAVADCDADEVEIYVS